MRGYGKGEFEQAIRDAITHLAGKPNDIYATSALTISYLKTGRLAEARDTAARLRAMGAGLRADYFDVLIQILDGGRDGVESKLKMLREASRRIPFFVGLLYHYLGDLDSGFEVWNEAYEERDQVLSWMLFMFKYAPDEVPRDPRFKQLLERMGLHDEWREELRRRAASLNEVTSIEVRDRLPDVFA